MDLVLVGVVLPGVENHSLARLRHAAVGAGFDAVVVPFCGWQDVASTLAEIERRRPRVVGVSLQTNQMALPALSLVRLLRQRGFAGTVVCGGHFATLNAEEILESPAGIDGVVRFAGEEALMGLLRDEERSTLPGLVYRDADGTTRSGAPARVDSATVASAPLGDGGLPEHLGFPAADVIFSRGCEAHCAYCCVAAASDLARREVARSGETAARGAGYQRRSVDAIADEIGRLWHEHGARVFNFMDDNVLPLDAGEAERWVSALGRALADRKVGRLAFSMQLRGDAASPAVVDGLRDLGLVRAYVGVDAASARQLRTLGRHAAAQAGPTAIERLSERGVFVVCNALILGPTFRFESVLAELAALERIRRAPVHLYPVDVRAGTSYLAAVERRGLVEGGFLWRRYRFEDPRTALLAQALAATPTRLAERSVAIGLYDLGYNLGIARRLVPEADVADACAAYERIAARWNADQLRLLRAAAEPAARLDRAAIERLIACEAPRVRALDEGLLAECDGALAAVARAVSRARRRPARPHARGRLLSALAMSMTMAACDRDVLWSADDMTVGASGDLAKRDLATGDLAAAGDAMCAVMMLSDCALWGACHDATMIDLTFDQDGRVTTVQASGGGMLPQAIADCYHAFFASYCYPSLANTTQSVVPHCFIA